MNIIFTDIDRVPLKLIEEVVDFCVDSNPNSMSQSQSFPSHNKDHGRFSQSKPYHPSSNTSRPHSVPQGSNRGNSNNLLNKQRNTEVRKEYPSPKFGNQTSKKNASEKSNQAYDNKRNPQSRDSSNTAMKKLITSISVDLVKQSLATDTVRKSKGIFSSIKNLDEEFAAKPNTENKQNKTLPRSQNRDKMKVGNPWINQHKDKMKVGNPWSKSGQFQSQKWGQGRNAFGNKNMNQNVQNKSLGINSKYNKTSNADPNLPMTISSNESGPNFQNTSLDVNPRFNKSGAGPNFQNKNLPMTSSSNVSGPNFQSKNLTMNNSAAYFQNQTSPINTNFNPKEAGNMKNSLNSATGTYLGNSLQKNVLPINNKALDIPKLSPAFTAKLSSVSSNVPYPDKLAKKRAKNARKRERQRLKTQGGQGDGKPHSFDPDKKHLNTNIKSGKFSPKKNYSKNQPPMHKMESSRKDDTNRRIFSEHQSGINTQRGPGDKKPEMERSKTSSEEFVFKKPLSVSEWNKSYSYVDPFVRMRKKEDEKQISPINQLGQRHSPNQKECHDNNEPHTDYTSKRPSANPRVDGYSSYSPSAPFGTAEPPNLPPNSTFPPRNPVHGPGYIGQTMPPVMEQQNLASRGHFGQTMPPSIEQQNLASRGHFGQTMPPSIEQQNLASRGHPTGGHFNQTMPPSIEQQNLASRGHPTGGHFNQSMPPSIEQLNLASRGHPTGGHFNSTQNLMARGHLTDQNNVMTGGPPFEFVTSRGCPTGGHFNSQHNVASRSNPTEGNFTDPPLPDNYDQVDRKFCPKSKMTRKDMINRNMIKDDTRKFRPCPVCHSREFYFVKDHFKESHLPWFLSFENACWECKKCEENPCLPLKQVVKDPDDDKHFFSNNSTIKWIQLVGRCFSFLKERLGLFALDDLIPYVKDHRIHIVRGPKDSVAQCDFSPLELHMVSAFGSMHYNRVVDKTTLKASPPNDLASLLHWRVLGGLLGRLDPQDQLAFKAID